MSLSEQQYMELALRMGRRHMGMTAENPSVGCLIVNQGNVVGRGVTALGGRPHAETQALQQAGETGKGADVFVTLEPCAHYGNTPPCCEALANAGVGRVVSALADPDPRTSGSGHQLLRDAGITVKTGVCENAARRDLAGFLSRIERGRPHVTLKLAVSLDGMISAGRGEQTAITGSQALRHSQMMRLRTDAIMVGAETVRIDDPSLTCRLPGLGHFSPIRVVVCSTMSSLAGSKLAKTAAIVPVWALTGQADSTKDVETIICGKISDGTIDLVAGLEALGARGVGRLLVEGGAALARSFLKQGLVDEICLFEAPHRVGTDGVRAPLEIIKSVAFEARETVLLGADTLTVYDRAN